MANIPKIPDIEDVGKIADDLISTSEERDAELTKRLSIDTTSPFMLPHLIRPIIALVILAMQMLIFLAMFLGITVPTDIIWQVGGLNAAVIGFYFSSRKAEKLQTKNAQATIELEQIKVREAKRKDKVEEKRQKKIDRQNRRSK
jgi:hypothetical protein